jgi:predicted metalloprotease with PDZ domain
MSAPAPRTSYHLAVPEPESHLCEVEMVLERLGPDDGPVELTMAAWCPGSYLIRDYARYVRDLEVSDGDGAALAVAKVDKQTWRIERGGAAFIRVRYRVYGHELSVRTNHIDGTHAFLHGPATYLFCPAMRDEPCLVRISPPRGRDWDVALALPESGGGYLAADVDELLDSPVHLGLVTAHDLAAAGAAARLVVWGEPEPGATFGVEDLARDLETVMQAHAGRFGGTVPYPRYTFVLMLSPDAYGGLEHRASSANLATPLSFSSARGYQDLLELLSHEFFHVWNGKRIFPEPLARFDYSREVYTRCLWVMEGLTSYYDRHTVLVTGKMPVKRYLEKLMDEWAWLTAIPGRRRQSLEESSFDAWIRLYKPDEQNLNTTVSYYLKGGIVALALDLEIRRESGGERSLDDVLRLLWERFGAAGRGYPEDVEPIFAKAAGVPLADFFARFVRGREEPDLGAALAGAGLRLEACHEKRPGERPQEPVWLGAVFERETARVGAVLEGGPAAAGGLGPGDEVIALDRLRVASEADLRRRLLGRAAGARAELAVFRRGRLTEVEIVLAASPPNRYEVHAQADPAPAARQLYENWTGESYPPQGLVSSATIARWT